jgi:galactitol-specific phosphotransferase system IIB component
MDKRTGFELRLSIAVVLIVALFAFAGILVACGGGETSASNGETGASNVETSASNGEIICADFPYYDTVQKLVETADIIVTGKVVGVERRAINVSLAADSAESPWVDECLVSSIEVKRVIKGDVEKGDIVEVKQQVGLYGQETRIQEKNGVGIFFLATYPNGIPCDLMNPQQGMVAIENGQAKPHSGNVLFPSAKTEADVIGEIEAAIE